MNEQYVIMYSTPEGDKGRISHEQAEAKATEEYDKFIFAFDKMTLLKGQVFRTYLYESGGSRNFTITFDVNDINKAKGE